VAWVVSAENRALAQTDDYIRPTKRWQHIHYCHSTASAPGYMHGAGSRVQYFPQLIKHIDYPLLPGVLFSECCRLGKRKLAEQLKMLFRLHTQPEMRHALILLCWCDFTTGSDLDEWYSLHLSNADELKQWISARQKTYRELAALTKDYIDATRPL
jgi:hypothetical protein